MAREGELKTPVITVDVDDIDATLQTVEQLGGSVVAPKDCHSRHGLLAYFKDTEGNILGLWENLPAEQRPRRRSGGAEPEGPG